MATNPSDSAIGYAASTYAPGEIGLTKREYFASQAFHSMSAFLQPYEDDDGIRKIVKYSVKMADALIAELNKTDGIEKVRHPINL